MKEKLALDWLADTALMALEKKSTMDPSWIADKRHELAGLSRLKVLHWIVTGLDGRNLFLVAGHLEVSVEDLAAVRRVLSKI
jgi:hypothetical protein